MKVFFLTALLLIGPATYADELDSSSQEALKKTQELLNDPEARSKAIATDPKAVKVDDYVNQVTGGDKTVKDGVYALAAEVFEKIVKDSNGDPEKMKKALEEVSRNPADFAGHWTPEQLQKLHELSSQLPDKSIKP